MDRTDFQRLADIRVEEAKILLDAGKWSGAYYLAGYAVECALKACIIVKLRNSDVFPEKKFSENCYSHNLEGLAGLAGIKTDLIADAARSDNWTVVKDWNEASRYAQKTQVEAETLYLAITDPTSGVLPWLRLRW